MHRQGLPVFSQPKALDNGVPSIMRPYPHSLPEANLASVREMDVSGDRQHRIAECARAQQSSAQNLQAIHT